MKIIDQTTRESYSSIQKTPVSELQPTSELAPDSLIHIVQSIPETGGGTNKYESMKMKICDFQNKMYESVQNTLKTEYWDTHCGEKETTHTENVETDPKSSFPKGTSFKELIDYLGEYNHVSNNKIWQPTQTEYEDMSFVNHVYYDFDVVKRYMVKKDNELQSEIDSINDTLVEIGSVFSTNMQLWTTDKNGEETQNSVNHVKGVDDDHCQMVIRTGNKISNTWIVPATGNLVVYGWLDSSEALNNRAVPSSFCVLEANVNPIADQDNWEIISVQPVMPFKSMTYVGFNVPVRKGLMIRARTGFTVGAKSGAHSNEQDGNDSLSNSTANGFKCQVFCHKDYGKDMKNDNA